MTLNWIFYQRLIFILIPMFVVFVLHRSVYDAFVLYGMLEFLWSSAGLLTVLTIKLALWNK